MKPPARREPPPTPCGDLPSCPDHLVPAATEEWHRVVRVLHDMGVLTQADRGAMAAYCQAYGRWVEAEEMHKTPMLFRTPSGYVQQSPWLGIIHKQLEVMGRYMVELGMTPAARSRVAANVAPAQDILRIESVILPYPPGTEPEVIHRGPMDADTWLARHGGSG